jgi:hypothetical protein
VIIKSGDFNKVEAACSAFGCKPYFAIVVDAGDAIRVFITAMEHLLELFPRTSGGDSGWKMSDAYLDRYSKDSAIIVFELQADMRRWWT